MCGIWGITEKNEDFIKNSISISSHRGPDAEGVWSDNHVTLGHNLLSITEDPDLSIQPWMTEKDNILIFNGEILNYWELCEEFKGSFSPKTKCDTELLAWGLDHYGKDFIKKIDSMHAFAFYNKKEGKLILSRDISGIKPLYYSEIKEGLVFGSEIKPLLSKVKSSSRVNEIAFYSLTSIGLNATEESLFNGIKKLMSGQTITYDVINKKIIDEFRDFILPYSDNSFNEEAFREEIRKSVGLCTLGIRQFGVFLSGGLDSSVIGHELNNLEIPFKSYTNKFKNTPFFGHDFNQDAKLSRKFASKYDFKHKEVLCDPDIFLQSWNKSVQSLEEPIYSTNLALYYFANKFLSKDGVIVTLAGDAGDELLGGYPKYFHAKKEKLNSFSDLIFYWLNRYPSLSTEENSIHGFMKTKSKITKLDFHDYLLEKLPESIWNKDDPVNSYMAMDVALQLPEDFFLRNDKFGMAFSMEARFPFATKRFMKYAMSIHSNQKLGSLAEYGKIPIRSAYENILPSYITKAKKVGWKLPLVEWGVKVKKVRNFFKTINAARNSIDERIQVSDASNMKQKLFYWQLKTWVNEYNLSFEAIRKD